MPGRFKKLAYVLVFGLSLVAGGILLGWVLFTHHNTGQWRMPTGDDLVRIEQHLVPRSVAAPRVVYLHREAITLSGGIDDASKNISSVIGRNGTSAKLRGFRGSQATWKSIVSCVRATFRPFDIEFVEDRPSNPDYIMAVVGGSPRDIAYKGHHVGGLAPYNGDVIPRAIVFAFSDTLGNRKRATCNTIAMEVAHAYGLDHAYDCSDVMTYLPDCGPKYFRDKDVPCGESEPRPCPRNEPTQNSYKTLSGLVGLRPVASPVR